MIQEIWNKLSIIDVSEEKKKRGQFDYLPWNVAISIMMEHYPDVNYDFLHYTDSNGMLKDYIVAPDGSCSVECQVTINGITKKMFLAVTDYNNKAIKNPSSVDINNTKMRCLTKCIATGFGLGWYIYKGDALPPEEFYTEEQVAEFDKLYKHEFFQDKKQETKQGLSNILKKNNNSKSSYQHYLDEMQKAIDDYENQKAEEINQDLDNQMKAKI
tara:strand:+ start:751 stop:1392 length:642 start_codon:yes stop_codon:yes gene_type:complete